MIIDSWMAERLSFSWLRYAFPDLPFPVLSRGAANNGSTGKGIY